MRQAIKQLGCTADSFKFQTSPKFRLQDAHQVIDGWARYLDDVVETPPERVVQHSLMVGRGDEQRWPLEAVEQLEESVHNTPKLAVVSGIGTLLAQCIELIKEHHKWAGSSELEKSAQVRGCLT